MNDKILRARIALARFAIKALTVYILELEGAKETTMSLRQIAQAILDALNSEGV